MSNKPFTVHPRTEQHVKDERNVAIRTGHYAKRHGLNRDECLELIEMLGIESSILPHQRRIMSHVMAGDTLTLAQSRKN